jgi:hypothetical protein
MADENVPIDFLIYKHLFLSCDPTDPKLNQILVVEHGGRTLEVIVPLCYDARIGEFVAAAADGAVVFLLCRYDRPFDDFWGTLGFLVVAIPYKDGRYRAAIAHSTYALEGHGKLAGFGLYPPPRPNPETGATGDATDPVVEALLRARRAEPFVRGLFQNKLANFLAW